jgi:hypothetical protein
VNTFFYPLQFWKNTKLFPQESIEENKKNKTKRLFLPQISIFSGKRITAKWDLVVFSHHPQIS